MKKLLCLPLLFIVVANAGCVGHGWDVDAGEVYVSEKYLWVPVLGNIASCEHPKPSEVRKMNAEAESARSTADASAKKVVPIDVTVTDTP